MGERHRALGWFANIAIAVGLLFTFLGIIAALSTLDLSGGPDAMQSQLNDLMQVAGAKFWASVGGIVASIILRSVDYCFAKEVDEGLGRLSPSAENENDPDGPMPSHDPSSAKCDSPGNLLLPT